MAGADRDPGSKKGTPPDAGGPRRVLLVEDDDDVRTAFETVLADDFEVRSAETGSRALAVAQSWRPDVVLLDWTLPDLRGEEVVERLRSIPDYAALPIVLVSGNVTLEAIAARNGAASCPKPCDMDQLRSAIDHALRLSQRR